MILFHDNKLSTLSATSNTAGYTTDNLKNSDPKKKWLAGADDVTLSIRYSGSDVYVGLFGIAGAAKADIIQRDSGLLVLDTETISVVHPLNQIGLHITDPAVYRLDIRLYSGSSVSAGTLRVSSGTEIPFPEYGLNKTYESYGVRHKYKNGGYFSFDRGRARRYGGSAVMTYAEYGQLEALIGLYDAEPIGILVTPFYQQDGLFGSIGAESVPAQDYAYPNHCRVSFTVQEFI